MDDKDRVGLTIGFVIFIGIGLWATLDPTAMEDSIAIGRKSGLKGFIFSLWGRGFGFTLATMGILALVGLYQTKD